MRRFDRLARIYDQLAKLVFGSSLEAAKNCYIDQIPPGACILIVGGGTGKILNLLAQKKDIGEIHFLEPSPKMMNKAQKRWEATTSASPIHFHLLGVEEWPNDPQIDVLISCFVWDLFADYSLYPILDHLKKGLSKQANCLYVDFQYTGKKWADGLIWFMYRFFRLTTQIQAKKLPDVHSWFKENGFIPKNRTLFYHQMVESIWFERN